MEKMLMNIANKYAQERAKQIIHDLNKELMALRDRITILEKNVAEETEMRYSLYKRLAELNHTDEKGN
jgi:hypothetical protein